MADPWAEFRIAPTGGTNADPWAEFRTQPATQPTAQPEREPAAGNVPVGTTLPDEDVSAGMFLRGALGLGAYVPQAEAAIRATVGTGRPGATWSERYENTLPERQALYERAEQEQPIASTALQIGGGMAALAPLGATALGGRLLGATGSLPARIGFGGASGAGIAAADAAARGEDVGGAAKLGGGLGAALPVVGGALGKIGQATRAYRGAPALDELGDVVDAGYKALRGSGVEIKPQAVQSAINQIRIDQQIHPKLTPEVSGLLEDAATKGIMSPLTRTAGASFDDIDTLRKQLGKVARNYTNPTEQEAARGAIRGLDDFLANVTPTDVVRGNAAGLAKAATETRANAAAEFRLRAMNALRQRAEDQAGSAASGMNVENAYRQQLRAFIRPNNKGVSPAMKEGFTPSEINQLRWATRGSSFPNMLRLVSNVLGGGHGIMAGAGLATAYATGDPRYAAAVGAGYAGRRLSNAMMRNRADMLSRMTAARSPLATQMGVGGPVGPPLNLGGAQGGLVGLLGPLTGGNP
jgi:hypothetical protein